MVRKIITLCIFLTTQATAEPVSFELKVDPRFAQYTDLFESPSALVVVLENSGFTFSHAGRIRINNPRHFELRRNKSIPFKHASVTYTGHRGSLYTYKFAFDWSVGFVGKRMEIMGEIDTQDIAKGLLGLNVHLPLSFLMPDVLKGYVDQKITGLTNASVQEEVLKYLAQADKLIREEGGSRLEWMLLDAYNLPRHMLDEPMTLDRIAVGLLLVWLGILPLLLTIVLITTLLLRKPQPA